MTPPLARPTPARGSLDRRLGLLLSGAVVAGAVLHTSPLRDAASGAPATDAHLERPGAYVALAPACELADAIAALPLHVHFALMLSIVGTTLVWPARRRRFARRLAASLGAVLAVYALAVLVPRPTAKLVVRDPDAVVVDFHSHTAASHDGRRGHGVAENRAWHAAAGFDVAYVTDHGTFASIDTALAGNPRRAGDGTVLLAGVEVRDHGQHVNVLGTGPADSAAYVGGELHASALAPSASRVVLLTLPAHFERLPARPAYDAVELSDGSPRGIEQGDRERRAVLALADRLHLAVLAGSDDHGWARAAVAWSVLRIPGWRAMTPDSLDRAIRATIHRRGRDAVQVIERRVDEPRGTAGPDGSLASPADEIPARLWALCRALSWPERVAWLAWAWTPWALLRTVRRRRAAAA